jgi:hypothetical protein
MIQVNRVDLFHALDAVIPHAGSGRLAAVGIAERKGKLHLFATDDATAAISRVELFGMRAVETFSPVLLPTREAKELLRAVRPALKAHQEESVTLLNGDLDYDSTSYDELHVQVGEEDGEVYSLADEMWGLEDVLDLISRIRRRVDGSTPLVFNPAYLARFQKASPDASSRMRIYPIRKGAAGAALVTVGADFIGAIAGMDNYDVTESGDLDGWFGGEKEQRVA